MGTPQWITHGEKYRGRERERSMEEEATIPGRGTSSLNKNTHHLHRQRGRGRGLISLRLPFPTVEKTGGENNWETYRLLHYKVTLWKIRNCSYDIKWKD